MHMYVKCSCGGHLGFLTAICYIYLNKGLFTTNFHQFYHNGFRGDIFQRFSRNKHHICVVCEIRSTKYTLYAQSHTQEQTLHHTIRSVDLWSLDVNKSYHIKFTKFNKGYRYTCSVRYGQNWGGRFEPPAPTLHCDLTVILYNNNEKKNIKTKQKQNSTKNKIQNQKHNLQCISTMYIHAKTPLYINV